MTYASANTASALVQRDSNGDFSARNVNLSALTASYAVVTDGSKNLASLQYTSTNVASTLVQRDGNGDFTTRRVNATDINVSALTASYAVVTDGSKYLASLRYTSSNVASSLVSRDGNGDFSARNVSVSAISTASSSMLAMKIVDTTSSDGYNISVAHGLNKDNIVSVFCRAYRDSNSYRTFGHNSDTDLIWDGTNIIASTSPKINNGAAVKVFIIYLA
jgi:hypothetical protein